MDPIESTPYGNFSFRYLRKEDVDAALEHACEFLFESLECLGYEKQMEEDWRSLFKAVLETTVGLSFLAVETSTGKIAGLRVITIKKRDDPEESHFPFKWQQNKEMYDYFMTLADKCDIYRRYPDIDRFAELFGISVDPEFRRQGLAKEIYRRALALMKSQGFKIARCGFTSPFSRKAAVSLGCNIIVGEKCSEAKTPDGRLLNPNAKPDDICDFGFFEL